MEEKLSYRYTIPYGSEVNHAYAEAGTYNVTLTVIDNDEDTDSYTIPITVEKEKEGIPGFEIAFLIIANTHEEQNEIDYTR